MENYSPEVNIVEKNPMPENVQELLQVESKIAGIRGLALQFATKDAWEQTSNEQK